MSENLTPDAQKTSQNTSNMKIRAVCLIPKFANQIVRVPKENNLDETQDTEFKITNINMLKEDMN